MNYCDRVFLTKKSSLDCFGATTFSLTAGSIMTISIMVQILKLTTTLQWCCDNMLGVVMLSVQLLHVVMLSVELLSVVILSG